MALALAAWSQTSSATGTTGTSLTSTAFSPNAGDLIYILGWIDNSSGSSITESTPTDSIGLSWTLVGRDNAVVAGPNLDGDRFVWRASTSAAHTNMTVTISGGATGAIKGVRVIGFSGADSAQTGAQVKTAHPSATTTFATAAIVTSQAGSWCWMAAADWTEVPTTVTPASGQALSGSVTDDGGGDGIWAQSESPQPASNRASGTSVTMSCTVSGTDYGHLVAFEVVPAAGGTPPIPVVTQAQAQRPVAAPTQRSAIIGQPPVAGAIGLSDSGAGTDSLSVTVSVALTDAGQGSDSFSNGSSSISSSAVVSAVRLPELTITGIASYLINAQLPAPGSISLPDSGTGTDSLAITASISLADSGSGTDALAVISALSFTDTGQGSDSLTVTSAISFTDSGTGSDTLGVTAAISFTDTGQSSEGLGVVPGFTDTGQGTDSFSVLIANAVSLSDSGQGTDALNVTIVTPVSFTDTGSGADSIQISSSISLGDAGQGSEVLTVAAGVAIADAGHALDTLTINIPISFGDAGSAADSVLAVSVTAILLSDTGLGSDSFAMSLGAASFPGQVTISNTVSGQVIITNTAPSVSISNSASGSVQIRNST